MWVHGICVCCWRYEFVYIDVAPPCSLCGARVVQSLDCFIVPV